MNSEKSIDLMLSQPEEQASGPGVGNKAEERSMGSGDGFNKTEIGKVPVDWELCKLSDIVDIIGGGTPKTRVKEYWDGDIPWLSVVDFNRELRWVYNTEKTITQRGLEESSTKLLKKGHIIISARGTVGEIAQLGRDMAFNQSCYGLNAKEILTNDFLYCLLKYNLVELKTKTHGSVFDTITRKTFEQIKVGLPQISEQKAIAKILSDLDHKIELNRQMNTTLEAIGQAIFKHWFVDFEFPNEEGKPYKSSSGEMEETELGEVPVGWRVGILNQIAHLKMETVQPKSNPNKHWEHYSIPAFDENKHPVLELGHNIKSGKYRVPPKCVLASKLNPQFPRIWLPDVHDANSAICSTEFMPFVPNKSNWYPFLYELLKSDIVQSIILSRVTGSTGSRQRVKPKEIAIMPILVPPEELIDKYSEKISSLHYILLLNIQQSHTLMAMRDALLPKLMSGEIRVNHN